MINNMNYNNYSKLKVYLEKIIPQYAKYNKKKDAKLYKLIRDEFSVSDKNIFDCPIEEVKPITEEEKVNISRQDKFGRKVVNFINTMEMLVPREDLNLMYRNLRQIKFLESGVSSNITRGTYTSNNVIRVPYEPRNDIIYHELLHASSSTFEKKNHADHSGFATNDLNVTVGTGITEGFTQFITHAFFGSDTRVNNTYVFETGVMGYIADLFGRMNILHYYLNADSKGFVDTLSKYSSEEEVHRFIGDMDYLFDSMYGYEEGIDAEAYLKRERKEHNVRNDVYKEVNKFLIKLTVNKEYDKYCENLNNHKEVDGKDTIDYSQLGDNLNRYLNEIPKNISFVYPYKETTRNIYYDLFTQDEINTLAKNQLDNIMGDNNIDLNNNTNNDIFDEIKKMHI